MLYVGDFPALFLFSAFVVLKFVSANAVKGLFRLYTAVSVPVSVIIDLLTLLVLFKYSADFNINLSG